MVRIMGDRCTGKSCQLILYAARLANAEKDKNVYLLGQSPEYYLLMAEHEMNLKLPENLQFMPYSTINTLSQDDDNIIVIDNIDTFLDKIYCNVKGYTVNLQDWYDLKEYGDDWGMKE